jgi:pyruvate dehydrogenase (quinone)
MSKRVADVLVETLQAAGVKACYGIVGDTLNRIAHAIDRSEIDWVHVRHEEAGAFAAGRAQGAWRMRRLTAPCTTSASGSADAWSRTPARLRSVAGNHHWKAGLTHRSGDANA